MKRLGGWLFSFAFKLLSRQKKVRKVMKVYKLLRLAARIPAVNRMMQRAQMQASRVVAQQSARTASRNATRNPSPLIRTPSGPAGDGPRSPSGT